MNKLLLTTILAALLSLSAAPAAESYNATATGTVDGMQKTVKVTITIDRFSTQAEKDGARAAFDAGGTTGLAAKLQTMPSVGKLKLEDGRVFELRLTSQVEVLGGGRFVTVITARPIAFLGADKPGAKPIAGYGVGVIDLNLKANGRGDGTAAPAANIKIGASGGFQVEDYGSKTIWLEDVKKM
jgi:hypothetical protein